MFSFRKIFFLFISLVVSICAIAQSDTVPSANELVAKPATIPKKRLLIKGDSITKKSTEKESLFFTLKTKDSILITDSHKHSIIDTSLLNDSLQFVQRKKDSTRIDSLKTALVKKTVREKDTSTYASIFGGLYIPINLRALALLEKERNPEDKDGLFYTLIAILSIVAFTKVIFPRYFINMFSLLFQTSYRQKQSIEQLTNNKISSILLNVVFIFSIAMYVTLIFERSQLLHFNFWMIYAYCIVAFIIIYTFKFVFLHFMGWIFNTEDAMDSYSFIVFLNNKIIAIVLLPFIFILAFSDGQVLAISLIISYVLIGIALLYRFFIVMSSLRTTLKVNPLHFFLYLCGVEILPLLLIYKAVVNFIQTSI